MDVQTFVRLLEALVRNQVDYILIGGAAVALHGIVRATEDVDIFVHPDVANIERLKSALRDVWDDPAIDEISADELVGDYPSVRYGPPEGNLTVDILTRLGEAFAFDDLESTIVEFRGLRVRIATPSTLYRMKSGTVRPLDWADAEALAKKFKLEG